MMHRLEWGQKKGGDLIPFFSLGHEKSKQQWPEIAGVDASFFYLLPFFPRVSESPSLTSAISTQPSSSPSAQSHTASAAPALGRTHADQLIKNHLVENTNKAVSLWLALGSGVGGWGWVGVGPGNEQEAMKGKTRARDTGSGWESWQMV